jgi:hypothetical protein
MEKRILSELSDQELLLEASKQKKAKILNAVVIGFLIGIVIYSVIHNSFGFLMLIPLYFVHRLINQTEYDNAELDRLLRERNLK